MIELVPLEVLEGLRASASLRGVSHHLQAIAEKLGFEYFLYGVCGISRADHPENLVLSGYPPEWRARYDEQGYVVMDPVVRHCIDSVLRFIWPYELRPADPGARVLLEAAEFGLTSGASFPVHGPQGEHAVLSLATSRPPQRARPNIERCLAAGHLLACETHQAVRRVLAARSPDASATPALTARERECLLWAARGKTSWEIGAILEISERTAVFHLQNAAKKLGASTRQQAIARALVSRNRSSMN